MTIHEYSATLLNGKEKALADFEGEVVLIVNTASNCGFTPQYKELQFLYDSYKEQGFSVLGFPCNQFMNQEPGDNNEIASFCERNYGVTFPMFEKVDVKGKNAHPLFNYLTSEKGGILTDGIKWNFTKFLVDQRGRVHKRYAPNTSPLKIKDDIEALLMNN
ncbi:glutathione peroxidase [Halalkalibacterium ligniniphilum]|uniref:glutathione peroxidase n=1 Tax=Halalkalibacterium ligniniphilum TaxID=1134413 RepID=UPI00034C47B5|nr:glutathione peroxidase [Halalkalibacterium ligniniphilum]